MADIADLRLLTVEAEPRRSSSASASSNLEAAMRPRAAPILPRKLGFFWLDVLFEEAAGVLLLSGDTIVEERMFEDGSFYSLSVIVGDM